MEKEIISVYSEKEGKCIDFDLNDESNTRESYECVGMSNADYGS